MSKFKKSIIILIYLCLFIIAGACNGVVKDGIRYNGFEVIGKKGNDKEIYIQSKVNGKDISSIRSNVFAGTDITKVVMPDSITSLKSNAFADCKQLKEVIFSENLTSIGEGCFKNCENLDNVYIVGNVNRNLFIICVSAFENCTSLKTIHLENITMIDTDAFKGCSSLTKIYLDKKIYKMGSTGSVFADCNNLEIYCEASEQSEKWVEDWNSGRPVHWGVTREEYDKLP